MIKTSCDEENLPRWKMKKLGCKILSDAELLAIVLRTGGTGENVLVLSQRLLKEFGDLNFLYSVSFERLKNIKNVGEVKALVIKACLELGLRFRNIERDSSRKIKSPKDIFELVYSDFVEEKRETLFLISIGSRNNLISKKTLSIGTINTTLVSTREIYLEALNQNAVSIILCHNHPSYDPNPSKEDIETTRRVLRAGSIIGIPLLDHIIIGGNKYISMKSMGLLKGKGGDK